MSMKAFNKGAVNYLCVVTCLRLTQHQILRYVKTNQFEVYLMVSSKYLGCLFTLRFFVIRQKGEGNVWNYGEFLFGLSPDVQAKSTFLQVTLNFKLK